MDVCALELAPVEGRTRVVVEHVEPEVDCGRFAAKRIVGDVLAVEADVFADGHDEVSTRVLYRHESEEEWRESRMRRVAGDRWRGEFVLARLGTYRFTVEGWIERFLTWRRDLRRCLEAHQEVGVEFLAGAALMEAAAGAAEGQAAQAMRDWARRLREDEGAREDIAADEEAARLVQQYSPRRFAGRYEKELRVVVDREKARFSTWYELFPRSCATEAGRHGTLRDCEGWLPYVAGMGFDVLYLPPIHPIGRTFRKGKNNLWK